jgi:AraC-like DNA-binding protein
MKSHKIPTVSICNLISRDSCMTEFQIWRIREFMELHPVLQFPHRHAFFQMVLFTQGGGRHSIDFNTFAIQPNQLYGMTPGQIHTWQFDPETDGYIINFNEPFFTSICHNPNFVYEFPIFSTLKGEPIVQLEGDAADETRRQFDRIYHDFLTEGDFKNDLLRAMLLELLVRLSRHIQSKAPLPITKSQYTILRSYEKMIEQHFREKHLPKEYAEMLFVTPNHLNALCNAATGKPAGEMIRDRILLEAKRLLVNSSLTITEIAYQLNFEDNSYFSRFFRKYTGAAPEAFRRRTSDVRR